MSRKRRTFFPGAKYHIISRGNRKSPLFYDDEDRIKYFNLLLETMNRSPFVLHTYCLMTNHIHLQLETTETSPAVMMNYIQTKYAKYFNKKYHYTGHVFEKRYDAVLLDSLDYEFDVSKYIHLNPVKAGLVAKPENYPWSSYCHYFNGDVTNLVNPHYLLSFFPDPAPKHYENYVRAPFVKLFLQDNGKVVMLPHREEELPCVPR